MSHQVGWWKGFFEETGGKPGETRVEPGDFICFHNFKSHRTMEIIAIQEKVWSTPLQAN